MFKTGIFTDFKLPTSNDIELLQRLKADDVYLGLNNEQDADFKLFWNKSNQKLAQQKLIDKCKELRDLGFTVHIMPWLRPLKEYSEQCAEVVLTVYEQSQAVESILFDCEVFFLKKGLPSGFDHQDALDEYWFPVWQDGIVYGVTSYAYVRPQLAPLLNLPAITYGIPQAYSIYNPKMPWTLQAAAQPGQLQKGAFNSWSKYDLEVVMGLPAYKLTRPNMSQLEAMQQASTMTHETLGINRNAYWSLGNIKYSKQRIDFIRGLKDA